MCRFSRPSSPFFKLGSSVQLQLCNNGYTYVAWRVSISESIFIHSFCHLKERRLHSRSRSESGRGTGRRGCPRLRNIDTRMLPAQIVAAGKSPHLTIPWSEGEISAKPEHPGQFDIAANTRCSTIIGGLTLSRTHDAFLRENLSRLFFFSFYFFRIRIPRGFREKNVLRPHVRR